jgi:hypothetical protein
LLHGRRLPLIAAFLMTALAALATLSPPATPEQPPADVATPAPASSAPATPTPAPAAPPAVPAPAPPAAPAAAAPTPGAQPAAKSAPAKGKPGSKTAAPAKPAAPPKPPPPPPKPPVPNAALAQLKPLIGSWTCTGHTFGPGPEHDTSAAMTVAWHLDGFWLEVRYDEAKTAANTAPFAAVADWGFDELQQGLAAVSVDNFGGSTAQAASGWQGNKLVFEGPGHRFAAQFEARDTYNRRGEDQLGHTFEAEVNGSWIKLHQDVCNRVPAK